MASSLRNYFRYFKWRYKIIQFLLFDDHLSQPRSRKNVLCMQIYNFMYANINVWQNQYYSSVPHWLHKCAYVRDNKQWPDLIYQITFPMTFRCVCKHKRMCSVSGRQACAKKSPGNGSTTRYSQFYAHLRSRTITQTPKIPTWWVLPMIILRSAVYKKHQI